MAKKETVVSKPKVSKGRYVVLTDFQYNGITQYVGLELSNADKYTDEDIKYLLSDKNKLGKPVIQLVE